MSTSETVEPTSPGGGRKPRRRLLFWGGLLVVFLALAVRLAWVASRTETGWETITQQWRDATVGLFLGDHVPVGSLEPIDQAEYWLRETDRILAADPDNAELAMGAALLLDSPGPAFGFRYIKQSDVPRSAAVKFHEYDYDALERAIDQFENRCRPRCLALAAKATELQPNEVRWWRLRAMLLFRSHKDTGPRDPDRLDLLTQYAKHDPDNALYDYLAALQCLKSGLDLDKLDQPMVDRAKYERGMEYLHRGQKKPFCSAGGGESSVLLDFLRRSKAPRTEYPTLAGDGLFDLRRCRVVRDLWRVQSIQAERHEKNGDFPAALALRRQALRFADQCLLPGAETAFDIVSPMLRSNSSTALETLVVKHPELVSAEEMRRIKTAARTADREQKVRFEAEKRLAAAWWDQPNKVGVLFTGILMAASMATAPLLLILGACAWALARRLGKGSHLHGRQVGALSQVASWLAGYAIAFAVFGMFPAEIVPPAVQGWIILGSAALFVTVTLSWIVWRIMARRRFQYTIRTMLIVTFVWALLLGLLRTWDIIPFDLSDLSLSPHVPARGWHGFDAGSLQQSVATAYGTWAWATIQWMGYYGHYVAIGVSLALLAFWHHLRTGRAGSPSPGRRRDRWASLLATLSRSMLAAAILSMLVYLALAPSVVQSVEGAYQARMVHLRNPQAFYDTMTKIMAEVRADWGWMKADAEKGGGQ